MAYKDTLSRIIKDSGLSLREIAKRCEKKGISITPSYISQLQTGKLNPPSEEVSKAIAEVCKVDPIDLIIEGYIEKAPEIIKYYFAICSQTVNQFLELAFNLLHPDEEQLFREKFKEKIKVSNHLANLHQLVSYLRKLQIENNVKPIKDITKALTDKFINKYTYNETNNIFMEDDSMEPLIPKGALLRFNPIEIDKIKNSDIIIFSFFNTEKNLIRRYYSIDNKIVLIPENKNYELISINNLEEIILTGKVTSYIADV